LILPGFGLGRLFLLSLLQFFLADTMVRFDGTMKWSEIFLILAKEVV